MMPETTIGMTKTARRLTFSRMRDVSPTASRKAATFTTSTVTSENPNVNR